MKKINLTELDSRIKDILRDYRFHTEPLKSPILRKEIAARIRTVIRELREEKRNGDR